MSQEQAPQASSELISGTPSNPTIDVGDAQTIQDLIPENLRAAVAKRREREGVIETPEPDPIPQPPLQKLEVDPLTAPDAQPQQAPDPKEDGGILKDLQTSAEGLPTEGESEAKKQEMLAQGELDLSDEGIEKLVNGEIPLKDDPTPEASPQPQAAGEAFWQENETYQELKSNLTEYGADAAQLDALIQDIADKSTVDNSKLVQGYEDKIRTLESKHQATEAQLRNSDEIRKRAMYTQDPSVQQNLLLPMQQSQTEIANILQREGVETPLVEFMNAKNVTEVTSLVKDIDMPAEVLVQLKNQWRNYNELNTKFQQGHAKAQAELPDLLSPVLNHEAKNQITTEAFNRALDNVPSLKYVNDMLIEENPDLTKPEFQAAAATINKAMEDRDFILQGLSDPYKAINDKEYLVKLVESSLKSANNAHYAELYPKVLAERANDKATIEKLAHKLRDVYAAGTGRVSAAPLVNGQAAEGQTISADSESKEERIKRLKATQEGSPADMFSPS